MRRLPPALRPSGAHHLVDLRLVEGVGGAVDDRGGDVDEALQLAGDLGDAEMQRPRLAGLAQALDARPGLQHQAVHLPARGVAGLPVVLRRVLVGEDGKIGLAEAAIPELLRVALGGPLDSGARELENTAGSARW